MSDLNCVKFPRQTAKFINSAYMYSHYYTENVMRNLSVYTYHL